MPVLGRTFSKACVTSLACIAGVTAAAAGPDVKSSSLALPARPMVWSSLPRLTFWWQGAQPAGQPSQPAQPAQPAPAPDPAQPSDPAPAPADPAPADQAPAQDPAPAPQEGQPAPTPTPTPAPDVSAQAPSDEDIIKQAEAELASGEGAQEGEVIVVTGSAIERAETTTPAPVSVVDKEELEASGMVAVGDILQNLPAQSNAINIQENNGGDGTTQINLRGLGSERTLVLLNGRRHVPAGLGANAAVDLNTIPLAIIKRVEVLKDGASAVYGSDALGGVVNIITRDDFDGTEANVYTGTTQRGDGTTIDVSVVTGQTSERGNVLFSAGYVDQGDVFAGDRDFAEVQRVYDFDAGEESTTGSFTTPAGNIYVPEGTLGPDGETPADLPGSCGPEEQSNFGCTLDETTADRNDFRPFDGTGSSDVGEGDLYNFQPDNYLYTPSRRYNVFSSGNYKFHENFRGFFEASYVNRKSTQRLAPEPLSTEIEGTPISADSIYNPTGIDLLAVSRRMTEAGPRSTAQSIDTFRVVGGVGGRLPEELLDGWRWEASFNYGRSETQEEKRGNFVRSRVAQALGPSYMEDGVAKCGTPENPGPEDCVPLNLLGGPDSVTPEMINYLTYIGTASGFNQQRTFLGQLNGPLFTTPWNGDIMLAVGGDFRQEDGGQRADPLTAAGDTTGNKEEPTLGGYDVLEGFAELSVVPVRDQDWAKLVQFDAAARVVDYTTFGSAFTWKAGGMYRLPIGLAFRGTYSTAFRAPSIGELYDGESDSFQNATDPCNTDGGESPIQDPIVAQNCAEDLGMLGIDPTNFTNADGQMPTRVGGNPDLEAETAKVWTAGLVYEPTFAEGLGFSVDYFNVSIEDAIQGGTLAFILLSNCYALEDRADCEDITRSPTTGQITSMNDVNRNIGGTETDGVDFNINYDHSYTQVGRFRHNLEGTWLNNYDDIYPSRTIPGVGVYDLGVLPRWKFNFSTIWGYEGVGLGFNTRYIHGFRECGDTNDCTLENAEAVDRDVDRNITGDVFASYALKSPVGQSSLTVGVNNVTDQNPPVIYNGFLATSDSSTYDFLGRFFYARFSQAF
jgi:iron complex outermembrane recepter protein